MKFVYVSMMRMRKIVVMDKVVYMGEWGIKAG